MTFLIDTSIMIDLERKRTKTKEKLLQIPGLKMNEAAIPFIAYFECISTLESRSEPQKCEMMDLLMVLRFLSPGKDTAYILAELKAKYQDQGKVVPLADLMIAAQAIENNASLITKDKDFLVFDELKKIIIE